MASTLHQRIEKMAKMDRIWGIGFVLVLWAVYAFVFITVTSFVEASSITLTLLIGGALVLLFNTASVGAMLAQYARHKTATYEPDIRHLDEKRSLDKAQTLTAGNKPS